MAKDTKRGLPRELYFGDDERTSRTAEPLHESQAEELGGSRARTAGMSGGEVPSKTVDNEGTADDLSPETLLHEAGNSAGLDDDEAADADLTERDASKIGAGTGLDEAELAQREPDTDSGRGER